MILRVYCSGSIQKGASDTKKVCWTDDERLKVLAGASPFRIQFLNPDDPAKDLEDTEALFGRDMFQVQTADAVIVDARERRGIGIGIEMVVSRMVDTLLIVVAPPNSYYRMNNVSYRGGIVKNYIHPHVAMLADFIADNFEHSGQLLKYAIENKIKPKSSGIIDLSIDSYKDRMLEWDEPMKLILKTTS